MVRWGGRGAGAVVAVSLALVLTGCLPSAVGPSAAPSPSESVPPSPSAEPSQSPSAEPSPSASPDDSPVPVSVACGALISAQGMYDFNPNFSLLESFTPPANSVTARAMLLEGVVCRWINQTSGATIDVSVAQPGGVTLQRLRDDAASGAPVSGLGEFASFSKAGDAGVVEVFADGLWVTMSSVYFGSGEDARDLLVEVLEAVD